MLVTWEKSEVCFYSVLSTIICNFNTQQFFFFLLLWRSNMWKILKFCAPGGESCKFVKRKVLLFIQFL